MIKHLHEKYGIFGCSRCPDCGAFERIVDGYTNRVTCLDCGLQEDVDYGGNVDLEQLTKDCEKLC